MFQAGSTAVHTGFWFDHEHGRFRGPCLTLPNKQAAVLLAFLAVLVTFTANRSWKICRFVLLRVVHSSDTEPSHIAGRKRQRQVVLRNSETAGGALVSLLEVSATRRSGLSLWRKDVWRSVFLAVFALGHWAAFIAMGILTSQIIVGRTVTSSVTDTCGQWAGKGLSSDLEVNSDLDRTIYDTHRSLLLNQTLDADNYVRNCYEKGVSRGILDCGKLMSRSLPFVVEHNASCPFDEAVCLMGDNSAFGMDTGHIAFSDLGINYKFAKDLSVRRRTVCAPIDAEVFRERVITSETLPALQGNETLTFYSFVSYQGENRSDLYRNDNFSTDYTLRSFHFIPDLVDLAEPLGPSAPDHDVSIITLRGGGVTFQNVQDDPWFSAHEQKQYDNSTGIIPTDWKRYRMDRFLNVLGCDERVQLCSAVTGLCTPWSGLYSEVTEGLVSDYLADPTLQEKSPEDFNSILYASIMVRLVVLYTSIPESIQSRSASSALQASRYLVDGDQYRLESEQWKLELDYWFSMALARLQLEVFNTIEKPPSVDAESAQNLWAAQPSLLRLCGRVKFRSVDHTTLSTIGVVVVLVVSCFLTVLSFFDVVVERCFRKRHSTLVSDWVDSENLTLLEKSERQRKKSSPYENDKTGIVVNTMEA